MRSNYIKTAKHVVIFATLCLVAATTATLAQNVNIDSLSCDNIHCDENGIGIGVATVPNGYKLAINGKVIMERGVVEVKSKWPDYVFEQNYALASLIDIKAYIDQNGHLPNVPSAASVKKEGMDVEQINILLMQKIEELSLHVIQLHERLKALKSENEKIKGKQAGS